MAATEGEWRVQVSGGAARIPVDVWRGCPLARGTRVLLSVVSMPVGGVLRLAPSMDAAAAPALAYGPGEVGVYVVGDRLVAWSSDQTDNLEVDGAYTEASVDNPPVGEVGTEVLPGTDLLCLSMTATVASDLVVWLRLSGRWVLAESLGVTGVVGHVVWVPAAGIQRVYLQVTSAGSAHAYVAPRGWREAASVALRAVAV